MPGCQQSPTHRRDEDWASFASQAPSACFLFPSLSALPSTQFPPQPYSCALSPSLSGSFVISIPLLLQDVRFFTVLHCCSQKRFGFSPHHYLLWKSNAILSRRSRKSLLPALGVILEALVDLGGSGGLGVQLVCATVKGLGGLGEQLLNLEGISDMDIPGRKKTKVGTCIRDEKPSLVRVACALRGMLDDVIQGVGESPGIRNILEYAAQNMTIDGVSSPEPGNERKVVNTAESVTTCAHSCAHHAKLMDIALWSSLPEELQELVFARLSWPEIIRVQILSKGWNQKLMSGGKDSQLKQACARAQPKLVGLLALGTRPGSLMVSMLDTASYKWHMFETSLGYDPKCGEIEIELMSASDGGLVCLLSREPSKSKKTPRLVFVCNPLTRVWKRLPPLYGIVQEEIMVQLIMDRETKHYRVLVVGYTRDSKVGNLVHVYHSETGQWTKADGSSSGEVVYGYLYNFNSLAGVFDYLSGFSSGRFKPSPCSYNFADGMVHEIATDFGDFAYDSVLVKDRFFWLKVVEPAGGLPTHCIEEYQAVHCGASWTLLKEYPFNLLPRTPQRIQPHDLSWSTSFFATKDFLLLCAFNELGEENRREFLYIYEFSGDERRELPMMPGGNHLFLAQEQMCELRIDSVP